jgi:hypothetical protein
MGFERKIRYCRICKLEEAFVLGDVGDWVCTKCFFREGRKDDE